MCQILGEEEVLGRHVNRMVAYVPSVYYMNGGSAPLFHHLLTISSLDQVDLGDAQAGSRRVIRCLVELRRVAPCMVSLI